jgi:adenylate cyclase
MSDAYLEVIIAGERKSIQLNDCTLCRLGRSDQSTLVLPGDAMVSRSHAMVQRSGKGDYYVSDLGSRNGTLLNGRPLTKPLKLTDGDVITLGGYRVSFHMPEPSSADHGMPATGSYGDPTSVMVAMRLTTVLVVDIRNYTRLTRQLGEARIAELMSQFFREAGSILNRSQAWGQKFIGDAVMALWTHESDRPTMAEYIQVFRSLLDLSNLVRELNHRIAPETPISVGAGLNTGWCATGNLGSANLADHTALGDTVNRAFRLEAATKDTGFSLMAGRPTYDYLAVAPAIRSLLIPFHVKLKGYETVQEAWATNIDQIGTVISSSAMTAA